MGAAVSRRRGWVAVLRTALMRGVAPVRDAGPLPGAAGVRGGHRSVRAAVAALTLLLIAVAGGLATAGSGTPAAAQSLTRAPAAPTYPDWFRDATIYEVNIRQFTKAGTFKAFQAHLPRLKTLGVKVLWLMPIHPIGEQKRLGTLGSYYSVRDYTKVNPEFGTAKDFKALVAAAHKQGFKVILDWVANHTAWDNPWVSAHPDWYTQNNNGEIISPAGTGWSDVADLDYSSAGLRAAMTDALKVWVRDYDVDGFRCDVAGMVPTDFWEQAVAKLRAIKPVLMLAENQSNADLLDNAFLLNYNWSLLAELRNIGVGWVDNSRIRDLIAQQADESAYPGGSMPMNFVTNHDENSWNGTEYEELGAAVPPLTVMTFTLPGAPMVYTGQEIALKKRLKFFDKDEVVWPAKPADVAIGQLITKLTAVKKANPALFNGDAGGSLRWLGNGDVSEVFTYARVLGSSRVVVMLNPSDTAQKVTVSLGTLAGKYKRMSDGKSVTLAAKASYSLPAYGWQVYTTK
ncbi:MAG: hypothetical protein KGP01_05515 [Actinomycetales bacterium]|nr:hypothetical protein [Actinomycetales bacterium]